MSILTTINFSTKANLDSQANCLEASFWAFLNPGLDSWNIKYAVVMLHQLWEFLQLFGNVGFTFRQKAVEKVEEHDVSIGQLKKIKR